MAKQIYVNLGVSADTGQAKQSLTELQQQLTRLINTPANFTIGGTLKKDITEASTAIASLQTNLKNATNNLTGNLNLTKFNQEMTQSGMSLEKYQQALSQMGPAGNKAFASLASSIAQAEVPLKRNNKLLTEFWNTLKNTARWQISSSLLHGFMGTLSSAYGYAKDLNKALTDIQIVTQASDEAMAQFAQNANLAAKQLSTTTVAYTKASLIYYQQGLNDQQVKERADITTKMANITSQSAQEVSNQMTAIWNNFAKGGENLEYYADVITALGAATASSSSEISTGLQKFAAIADTVGLSYENAAAALATITATTRQSADTVGTGLRTLFSRLQSLSLGETLDDGVTLTKYTKALESIGVQALDASGNLRAMDDILLDMGDKWQMLSDAQQTALAQTVGGVRQYTTLMALMENFDFYKENVKIAQDSQGTVQKQQEIYEKSWKAAADRMKASAESIYSDLLNDKAFISLTNIFSKFLDLIHNTITGLGGLKGILVSIGALMTTVFANKTAEGLRNLIYDIKMLTPAGKAEITALQQQGSDMLVNSVYNQNTLYGQTMSNAYQQQGDLQATYLANAEQMNAAQQSIAQSLMQQQATLIQNVELLAQEAEASEKVTTSMEMGARRLMNKAASDWNLTNVNATTNAMAVSGLSQAVTGSFNLRESILNISESDLSTIDNLRQKIQSLKIDAQDLSNAFGSQSDTVQYFNELNAALTNGNLDQAVLAIQQLQDEFNEPAATIFAAKIREIMSNFDGDISQEAFNQIESALNKVANSAENTSQKIQEVKDTSGNIQEVTTGLKTAITDLSSQKLTLEDGFVAAAGAASTLAMIIRSINGLIDVWNNKDLTFGQKITSTITTIGMTLPMIVKSFSSLKTVASFGNVINGTFSTMAEASTAAAAGTASLGAGLATVAGIAVAVVAAIIGVVEGIKKLYDTAHAGELNLKAVKSAAQELNDESKSLKTEAEELRSAFDEYNQIISVLDNCTAGTSAWYDALADVQAKVLEILNSFPQLIEFLEIIDDNGVPRITQSSMDALVEEYTKAAQRKQLNSTLMNYMGMELEAREYSKNVRTRLWDAVWGGYGDEFYVNSNGYKAYHEEDEAQWWQKNALPKLVEKASTTTKEDFFDWLLNSENSIGYVKGAYGYHNVFTHGNRAIGKYSEKQNKYIPVNDALDIYDQILAWNAIQPRNKTTRSTIGMLAANTELLGNENIPQELIPLLGESYLQAYQKIWQQVYDEGADYVKAQATGGGFLYGGKELTEADSIWGRWLESQKLSGKTYKLANNAIRGTAERRTFAYLDPNDNTEHEISLQKMAADIAAAEVLNGNIKYGVDSFETQITEAKDIYDNKISDIGRKVIGFLVNNGQQTLDNLTIDEIKQIKQDQARGSSVFTSLFPKVSLDKMATLLGYTNPSELFTTLESLIKTIDIKNPFKENSIEDKLYKLQDLNQLTLKEFNNWQQVIRTISSMGIDITDRFYNLISTTIGQDNEHYNDIIGLLATTDWSKWDAFDTVTQQLMEWFSDYPEIVQEIQTLMTGLEIANGIPLNWDVDKLMENHKKAQELVKTLKQSGGTISEEDYQFLTDYYADIAKYLIRTGNNGQYQFDALNSEFANIDLSDVLRSSLQEGLKARLNKIQQYKLGDNIFSEDILASSYVSGKDMMQDLTTKQKTSLLDALEKGNTQELIGFTSAQLAAYRGGSQLNTTEIWNNIYKLFQTRQSNYQQALAAEKEVYSQYAQSASNVTELLEMGLPDEYVEKWGSIVQLVDLLTNHPEIDLSIWKEYRDLLIDSETSFQDALMAGELVTEQLTTLIDKNVNLEAWKEYRDLLIDIGIDAKKAGSDASDQLIQLTETEIDIEQWKSYRDFLAEISNLNLSEAGQISVDQLAMVTNAELNIDDWRDYVDYLTQIEGLFKDNAVAAGEFAIAQMQLEAGVASLSSTYNTWSKILDKTLKGTKGYAAALEAVRKDVKKIIGPTTDVTNEFLDLANAQGLIAAAATGSEEGITALKNFAAQYQLLLDNGKTAKDITELADNNEDFTNAFMMALGEAGNAYTDFADIVKNTEVSMPVIDTSGFMDSFIQAQLLAGKSLDSIAQLFEGFNVKLDAKWVPVENPGADLASYENIGSVYTQNPDGSTASVTYYKNGEETLKQEGGTFYALNVSGSKLGAGSGSGGGGGGGGGKKEPHKPKRYRNITNQIQNNDRKTQSVSRKKDRAFGTEKLDLLKQERDLREENLKLQQQYQSEIEDWLDKDKNAMMEAFSAIGFTPIFDEFGEVINNDEFEAAFEAIGDGSDEAWKKAEEALAQYEETLDLLNDQLITIEELQEQIFDSLLEEAQIKIELKLDVSNDRLEYIDYLLTKIDDDAYQAAEAIALLGEKTGETMAQAATYAAGIEEILSHHTLPDGTKFSLENIGNMSTEDLLAANFTQDEINQIQEWRSSLLQANESLLEMRKTITDKLISAFEDLNEKVQRSYELFDHYNTTLEHYKNITDLIAKGNSSFQSRAALEALNRSSFTNSVNQLTAAKRILNDMPKYLAEAEQQYQDALASGDRNRIVEAERYLQTIQDREQEAREQWEEAWENSLESAQSFFEFTMENIAKDYEDTMSGMFGTLDYLQQAYERHKEDAEWYLESYDSLYQLGKLSRDISRAIDDTDSIRIKQRYRDLQAEINKLQRENAELTQHDIDMLQREFDLEVARAALEDAKNAKTQVRLQRDSEGNWGYVYTADEDKVNDALDKYAEALHAFQQTNHEYFSQIQDDFMDLLNIGTEITDIMSDLDITQEEALANIDDLMSKVLGDDGHLQRLLDDLKQANADEEKIRELFTEIYGEDAVNNWLTFDDTLLKDLLNVDNIEELRNLLTEAYEAAIKAGKEAREQLATDVGQVGDAAGVSVEDFGEHIHGLVQHLDEESLAAIQSVDDLATAMNTTFTQAMQQALQWEKDYADQMANVIAQNEAFITSINEMIEALSGINGIEFYTRVNGVTGSAGEKKLQTFDSGGYTGNWGSYGRLAVLHEKEQIFNQDDTAKLLNAAQILRTLNLQTNLASQGLGQLNLSSMFDHINSDFNQNVQITAEFPNATNHSEIEEAFTNLINKASQYANRKGI